VLFDENNQPLEMAAEDINTPSRLGNIYVGHVNNIVKNIDAAFIETDEGCMCYHSLKEKASYLFGPHANNDRLCMGDYVLVQVEREDIKTKQPAVTGKLQFTGKYLVLVHGMKGVRISNKIKNKEENNRLKVLFSNCENENYGLIIRTNALLVSNERLKEEEARLVSLYHEICTTGIHKSKGSLLYQSFPWYIDLLRDLPADQLTEVVTDDEETRLKTMLPETTVFILKAEDVVPHLADIAPFLRSRQADGRVSYTSFITGPSRTADIERVSAIGVHGPLAVQILLVG
jgi:ribonuclease G